MNGVNTKRGRLGSVYSQHILVNLILVLHRFTGAHQYLKIMMSIV